MKKELALTPPMGWNSWDSFGTGVTEQDLLRNAEFMATHLKQYGYEYIVCDIQWYEPNAKTHDYRPNAKLCLDEYGRTYPAVNKFPSAAGGLGFKHIADKIHSMGLKFGIHILRGIPRQACRQKLPILGTDNITADQIANPMIYCTWNTDMYGIDTAKAGAYEYYLSLFKLYAEWGVDFVKVDDISRNNATDDTYFTRGEVELVSKALDNCGRDMVLSLSPGPSRIEYAEHYKTYANMWRVTDDFWDKWEDLKGMFDYMNRWYPHVQDGTFPDCDMLPLGRLRVTDKKSPGHPVNSYSRFTPMEQKMLMTFWCMVRSPLMMGGDLEWDDLTMKMLTNKALLKMHSYSDGVHPLSWESCQVKIKHPVICNFLIRKNDSIRIWQTFGRENEVYVAVFNIADIGIALECSIPEMQGYRNKTDLWSNETSAFDGTLKVRLAPHDCVIYKVQ